MLTELRIRNLAVIDSVVLSLKPGLNVLTGETGAGKSIIVGALSFLLGERASAEMVRSGEERASVEGVFEVMQGGPLLTLLEERGIDQDGTLILRREVSAAGRSRAWVNDTQVTASTLSEIGDHLVSIYGQNESRQLGSSDVQRVFLDTFANALPVAERVHVLHSELKVVSQELGRLEAARDQALGRAALLREQLHEIDEARLEPDEESHLDVEISRLAHAEELETDSGEALSLLSSGEYSVQGLLHSVRRIIGAIGRYDTQKSVWGESLDEVIISLDELVRDLGHYHEGIEVDPSRLRKLEARRQQLVMLLRKYGPTVPDAIAGAGEMRRELSLLENHDGRIAELEGRRRDVAAELEIASSQLTSARKRAAKRLSSGVSSLLPELGMTDAVFDVSLVPLASPGAHGAESIRFSAALNVGTESKPIDRIASGGELSRLMLAVSAVLSGAQAVPTLVFDEIDAGIGGNVAWEVGVLMHRLALDHQVFAISHLAQIAAQADHHISVSKMPSGGVTTADTTLLVGDARTFEIARMLGGDADSAVSREHAKELLKRGGESATPVSAPQARLHRRRKPV